jgi:sulfur carrier protein ThiS
MAVRVEISSSLRRYVPSYDPRQGLVLSDAAGMGANRLIARLGIPAQEVNLVLVNRKPVAADHVLADGDLVGLFPVIGGG